MKAAVSLCFLVACCSCSAQGFNFPGQQTDPLDVFFNKCSQPDPDGDIGPCIEEHLTQSLDAVRSDLTEGVKIDDEVVVVDPLRLDDIVQKNTSVSSIHWKITNITISGLSNLTIDRVTLTRSRVGLNFSLPSLTGSAKATIRYSFLPLRPTFSIQFHNLRIAIDAGWTPSRPSESGFRNAQVQIQADGFTVNVKRLASIGASITKVLNANNEKITEFIIPSLEAALAKEINNSKADDSQKFIKYLEKLTS